MSNFKDLQEDNVPDLFPSIREAILTDYIPLLSLNKELVKQSPYLTRSSSRMRNPNDSLEKFTTKISYPNHIFVLEIILTEDEILKASEDENFHLEKLIGLITFRKTFDKPEGSIGMGLLEKYQGMGYGKEMLKYLISILINENINKLLLTVDKDNTRAIKLYESLGFNEEDSDTPLHETMKKMSLIINEEQTPSRIVEKDPKENVLYTHIGHMK